MQNSLENLVIRDQIKYNNIYMFKNPIRHFLNVAQLDYTYDGTEEFNTDLLQWSQPVSFSIKKYYGKDDNRFLKLPNVINFRNLYNKAKKMSNFETISFISKYYTRIKVTLETGDFAVYNYEENIELDLNKLCIYDVLVKLDIKSFYDSINTHKLVTYTDFHNEDKYITNMKNGETNGILMGSYISLYLAENLLANIAIALKQKLKSLNIQHELKYFSDDFYIFCDDNNKELVKTTFTSVLNEYGFDQNTEKVEIYNYAKYSAENVLDKYWKIIINRQQAHNQECDVINEENEKDIKYYMNFLNQLIYRKTKLASDRSKSLLVSGFFKSNFFINLEINNYQMSQTNVHQILYLYKEHPEIMLYSIKKFSQHVLFKSASVEFFKKKFIESLKSKFYEEQLYYYYASTYILPEDYFCQTDVLEAVFNCGNQILQSYFVLNNKVDMNYVNRLLNDDEKSWFINYHVLLRKNNIGQYIDDLIIQYLVPKRCFLKERKIEKNQISMYSEIYEKNITKGIPMISPIAEVKNKIDMYLKLKEKERGIIQSKINSNDF